MTDRIETVAELEAVIGKTPPPMHLKVIDHLDDHALRWIAASPLAFVGCGSGTSIAMTLAGGEPGTVRGANDRIRVPLAALDDPAIAQPGMGFCSLFLAPGIGETLRVNGQVIDVTREEIHVAVRECFVHCAKALIRSDFWAATPIGDDFSDPLAFGAAARFLALATADAEGTADISPKGDPAGAMVQVTEKSVWFADRPGNRRSDSFRNILGQSRVSAVMLVPGSEQVLRLAGNAHLTTNEIMRGRFSVHDKVPLLATCIVEPAIEVQRSPALARARLWPVERPALIEPAKVLAAHVRHNRDKGLAAKVIGTIVSIPGLMQKGLDADYKANLY